MLKQYVSLGLNNHKPVKLNPENINNLDEILTVLNELDNYKASNGQEAVVALRINKHLGGHYVIVSKKYAEKEIKKQSGFEWYEAIYPRQFYENLEEKYK